MTKTTANEHRKNSIDCVISLTSNKQLAGLEGTTTLYREEPSGPLQAQEAFISNKQSVE